MVVHHIMKQQPQAMVWAGGLHSINGYVVSHITCFYFIRSLSWHGLGVFWACASYWHWPCSLRWNVEWGIEVMMMCRHGSWECWCHGICQPSAWERHINVGWGLHLWLLEDIDYGFSGTSWLYCWMASADIVLASMKSVDSTSHFH
jgi:hypothetical protein